MKLAVIIDKLSWVVYALYHSQGGKPSAPQLYPRPGVIRSREGKLSPQGRSYLERLRAANHAAWAKEAEQQELTDGG